MNTPGIMIVEDETIIREDLRQMLVANGYNVTATFGSAEDAISQIPSIKPDLILMDILLNGDIDGIEAAHQIGERFDIPVVFLTAYVDKEKLNRAKLKNTFAYLVKPVTESEMSCCIDIAIYKHAQEKKMQEEIDVYDSFSELLLKREMRIRTLREENIFLKNKIEALTVSNKGASQ